MIVDEADIRSHAIQFVLALRDRWVGIPPSELEKFRIGELKVHLKGQQGIFKPSQLSEPLSITSTLDSPYTDDPIEGTRVLYDFAPRSREFENDGLKRAAEMKLPLIYFLQTKRKPHPEYIAFAPVLVVAWDDSTRRFTVDLTETSKPAIVETAMLTQNMASAGILRDAPAMEKRYTPTLVQRRLHQARFRNEVLAAYRERCAVCVLRVRPLLDGAHIVPDRDPKPSITVSEGLALCATHHRAFDVEIMRFDTQYRVTVNLPSGFKSGPGEEAMLLAFEGRTLALPENPVHWPRFG